MIAIVAASFLLFVGHWAHASECGTTTLTPTTTFTSSATCTDISEPTCWQPHFPTSNDTAGFLAGVVAALDSPGDSGNYSFQLFSVKNLLVAKGAQVTISGQAMQVSECFVVQGTLELKGKPTMQSGSSPTAAIAYAADPTQPEGTDCALINIGFTPRICGPGEMTIADGAQVTVSDFYSSLFIDVSIANGGTLNVGENGFIWGRVTNNGTYNTTGYYTYMHGFLYNYGLAHLNAVAFDKWATSFVESPPLMIQNYGELHIHRSIHTTYATYKDQTAGVYKAALVNYNSVVFTNGGGWAAVASGDFDVFNFGTITWSNMNEYYGEAPWAGSGNFVNRGTFVADGLSVLLSTYHSVGGRLEHKNGGTWTFGNGAVNPRTVRLCTMQKYAHPAVKEVKRAPVRKEMVKERDGCWWYGDFCYHTPYLFIAPTIEKLKVARRPEAKLVNNGIVMELAKIIHSMVIPSPCTQRYSFNGKSTIAGDGSGSLVTTLPVAIEGHVDVLAGGRWYALTEQGNPPVWNGGTIRIRKAAEMYLGVDADFNHDGKLIVDEGGHLGIPKHAKVMVSNHTIIVRKGGIFHVDGKLSTHPLSHAIRHCGELRGIGKITRSKEDDMQC